jgi:hypothetical protein
MYYLVIQLIREPSEPTVTTGSHAKNRSQFEGTPVKKTADTEKHKQPNGLIIRRSRSAANSGALAGDVRELGHTQHECCHRQHNNGTCMTLTGNHSCARSVGAILDVQSGGAATWLNVRRVCGSCGRDEGTRVQLNNPLFNGTNRK